MGLDRKKLALIHIIKKDLDEAGFRKLMRFFVRSPYYRENPDAITLKQKMFIKSLADKLGWTLEHRINFINKYYHKKELDRLSKQQAAKVIESLKNINRRKIN